MLESLSFEWSLIKKRKIIDYAMVLALVIVLVYQCIYYLGVNHSSQIGNFINTFFFKDGNKVFFRFYILIFLPLLSAMLYSWYTISDRQSMFNISTRADMKNIIYARLLINFVVGFIFCFTMLVGISICTQIILWNNSGSFNFFSNIECSSELLLIYGPYSDINGTSLGNMFYMQPCLYYFIYFLVLSCFSGFQSAIACVFAYMTNKKIVVILSAFAINFLIFGAGVQLILPSPLKYYSFLTVLNPFFNVTNVNVIPYIWLGYSISVIIILYLSAIFICKRIDLYGKS